MDIQERLAKIRAAKIRAAKQEVKQEVKQEASGENRESSDETVSGSGINNVLSSISLVVPLLYPFGREEAVANLKLAIALNIYCRRECAPNYHKKGLMIFDTMLDEKAVDTWFSRYCIEPYPDVCRCGQVFYGSCSSLRSHCILCEGSILKAKIGAYDIQQIAGHTAIHYSWLEYAAAWALAKFQPSVIGSLEREQEREQERSHG